MKTTLSLLLLVISCSFGYGQYSGIDNTFGINGYARYADGINDLNGCIATDAEASVYVGGEVKITDVSAMSRFAVVKYSNAGVVVSNFGTSGIVVGFNGSGYNEVTDIYPSKDGGLYVLVNSSTNTATNYYKPTLYKYRSNGSLDTDFNRTSASPGSYPIENSFNYLRKYSKILVDEVTDDIYIGGDSTSLYHFKVVKLKKDGTKDTQFWYTSYVYTGSLKDMSFSFGKLVLVGGYGSSIYVAMIKKTTGAPYAGFSGDGYATITRPGYAQGKSVAVLEDGKIVVGGFEANPPNPPNRNEFIIAKLDSNGSPVTSFGPNGDGTLRIDAVPGRYSEVKKVILQPDKKILLVGDAILTTPTTVTSLLMCLTENGILENLNPSKTIDSISAVNVRGVAQYNGKVLITGGRNDGSSDNSLAVRINAFTNNEEYGLFGKDYISINKSATFTVDPIKTNYKYVWSYSSDSIFFLGQPVGSSVTINFAEFSPSGVLTCKIIDNAGNQVAVLQKKITVNQNPSIADLLAELTCAKKAISCDSTYIDEFKIYKTGLSNSNSSCDPQSGGYKDYTFSSYTDTLFLGDRYNMSVTCGGVNSTSNYAGIWIDFNNDGDFEDGGEFKNNYFSTTAVISINNFSIDNNADYTGPKRLRVRLRHAKEFTATESCPAAGENGEVEDYLILLESNQKLQATNFITPNADGQNDYFVIRGLDPPSSENGISNEIKIYNRFGDLVYSKANYANDFPNGTEGGDVLKNGTYYYVLTQKYKVADEEQEDYLKGFFELKR